jgi:hypothetical protein
VGFASIAERRDVADRAFVFLDDLSTREVATAEVPRGSWLPTWRPSERVAGVEEVASPTEVGA